MLGTQGKKKEGGYQERNTYVVAEEVMMEKKEEEKKIVEVEHEKGVSAGGLVAGTDGVDPFRGPGCGHLHAWDEFTCSCPARIYDQLEGVPGGLRRALVLIQVVVLAAATLSTERVAA